MAEPLIDILNDIELEKIKEEFINNGSRVNCLDIGSETRDQYVKTLGCNKNEQL